QLAHHRGNFVWLSSVAKHDGWPMPKGAALSSDDLTDKLIVRLVSSEGIPKPGVEIVNGLDAGAVGIGPQEGSPLVRPLVGIFRPFQKPINELAPFIRRLICQKGPRFIRRWQPANYVQVCPAKEPRITRQIRGRDAELLQFVPDVAIDEIIARQ